MARPSRPRVDRAGTAAWLPLGAAVALAALYAPAVTEMLHLWRTDTYAGHGMFVPLFSAVIAWTERARLRRAAGPGHPAGAAIVLAGLGLLEVPVYQSGVTIELPSMTLKVAEACNGLRFLMALLVLTAAFAQITQRTVVDRAALVVAAVPIAIVANAMRVAAIVVGVQY